MSNRRLSPPRIADLQRTALEARSLAAVLVVSGLLSSSLFTSSLHAQNGVTVPPITALKEALQVSDLTLVDLALPSSLPYELSVAIEIDGTPAAIVAPRRSVRADGFRVLVDDGAALREVTPPPVRTYFGALLESGGRGEGTVAASLLEDGVHAWIRRADGEVFALVPAAPLVAGLKESIHALYRAADSLADGSTCGVDDATPFPGGPVSPPLLGVGFGLTEIAFDADYEFFQKNSSSVSQTAADIESVLNGVQAIYQNDVGITYAITAIVIRTAEPDPYTVTNPGSLLSEFRVHWNQNHSGIYRDVAHLMTGKNIDGSVIGIAQLSVVCQVSSAYGLSQSKYTSNFTNRVALTAHELGHNWGSNHCSGSGCYIMCSSIGGCSGPITQFGAFAQAAIQTFKSNVGCLADVALPLPLPFFDSFAGPTLEPAHWTTVVGALVSTSAANPPSPPYSLNLDSASGGHDELRSVALALSGQSAAALSYRAEHVGVEFGESLVVEGLDAGAAWFELDRITSDGIDQTQFASRIVILPAPAYHNAFRLRFRVEGNQSNDDWFVDDVLIGPPPVVPPTIAQITPAVADALSGAPLTVTGTGFNAQNLQVLVGGVALLPLYEFDVLDAWTLQVTLPTVNTLAPSDLVISSGAGTTPPYPITYQATDPARILVSPLALNQQTFKISYGGQPGQLAFLLANLSGAVVPFQGGSLLDSLVFIPIPPTNAAGTGTISAPMIGLPPNSTLRTQVLLIPPPANDPSKVRVTNIGLTLILI